MPWELLGFIAATAATVGVITLAVDYTLDTIRRIKDGL